LAQPLALPAELLRNTLVFKEAGLPNKGQFLCKAPENSRKSFYNWFLRGLALSLSLLTKSQISTMSPDTLLAQEGYMKKLLFCAVATAMLLASVATPLMAQDSDECPCGADDTGKCLPCDDVDE
jgi:hypothetical protein